MKEKSCEDAEKGCHLQAKERGLTRTLTNLIHFDLIPLISRAVRIEISGV
jgi:hypothetical protein